LGNTYLTSRIKMPYFFTMRVPVSNSTFIAVSPSNSQARRSASTSATKSTVNGSSLSLYLTYFLKISAGANPVLPTKPATWPLVSESLEINAESVSLVYRDVWKNSQREYFLLVRVWAFRETW
jgi:hypothetical protein